MPPCMDVYVWLPERRREDLARFIEAYVDTAAQRMDGPRLAAFRRVYIDGGATASDEQLLAEQRLGRSEAFSLYLRGRGYYHAIITITADGAAVLGLSIDDPDGSPAVLDQARELIDRLREEFGSPAGLAGTELPPPRSAAEWAGDGLVQLRVGTLSAGGGSA